MSRQQLAYVPCAACGCMLDSGDADDHTCDAERLVEYRLCALRPAVARFDRDFRAWLLSVSGGA